MDWSKITNDYQTWKRAGRFWLTTNCDILPSTTKIPLKALTLAMHGWWWWRWWRELKKEKKKGILLGWKQTQTFFCLIPSLTCVAEVIQRWYKIKPQAILLLALNRRKRNPGLNWLALINLGTNEPRPTIWWHTPVCCLELFQLLNWPKNIVQWALVQLSLEGMIKLIMVLLCSKKGKLSTAKTEISLSS